MAMYSYYITKQTANFIKPNTRYRMPIFYILPKIHKVGVPGRPIVSAVGSITENISEFLTLCIQPLVPKLRSYVRDTKHFVSIIRKLPTQSNDAILVSADVSSLYTNIPHNEGIEACKHYMKKYKHELPEFTPNEGIIHMLLLFVLENNYFQFLNQIYLQIMGTAMGTKVAPPYAALFLGLLEETHIFEKYPNLITIFLRFLDDIFFIWNHGEEKLHSFFKYLNSIHPTIKFTYEYSRNEINFLDTTVYFDTITGELKTKLFIKHTDTRTFLHYDSYHPSHTKESIVYSQGLRYRMITTDDGVLHNELKELKSNLLLRGYPSQLITEQLNKVIHISQNELIEGRIPVTKNKANANKSTCKPQKKETNLLPFIIPYHKLLLPLKQLIHKHWFIIEENDMLKTMFPNKPFLSFTRHRNIQDHLISSKLKEE